MKTSPEMFADFTKECHRLQKVLNLLNWSIYFDHKKIKGAVAECSGNSAGCVATVSLNTDTGETPINPVECAKHEMWHLFFWRLQELFSKKLNKQEKLLIDQEIERMVCVLEKLRILEEPLTGHNIQEVRPEPKKESKKSTRSKGK